MYVCVGCCLVYKKNRCFFLLLLRLPPWPLIATVVPNHTCHPPTDISVARMSDKSFAAQLYVYSDKGNIYIYIKNNI